VWRPWRAQEHHLSVADPASPNGRGAPKGSRFPALRSLEPFHGVEAAAGEPRRGGPCQIQAGPDGSVELAHRTLGIDKEEGKRETPADSRALAGRGPRSKKRRFVACSKRAGEGWTGCRGGVDTVDISETQRDRASWDRCQSPPRVPVWWKSRGCYEADAPRLWPFLKLVESGSTRTGFPPVIGRFNGLEGGCPTPAPVRAAPPEPVARTRLTAKSTAASTRRRHL